MNIYDKDLENEESTDAQGFLDHCCGENVMMRKVSKDRKDGYVFNAGIGLYQESDGAFRERLKKEILEMKLNNL